MALGLDFASPYFTGATTDLEVPARFHCALAGRRYMIDTKRLPDFRREAIRLLREQADNSNAPGEQTLSPEELWRRSADDWSHGAGQVYLDREDSDNARFRSSKGVDIWTRWSLSLLSDTEKIRNSANTNLRLAVAGTHLYVTDGVFLAMSTDANTFTTVTGPPFNATAITSDGYNVFTAHGGFGIYSTTRGAATASAYNSTDASLVGYAKGRLLAADGPILYNITGPTTQPILMTHANSDFQWVGFAEGNAVIYAAGYSGDKSLIYRIGIKPDATALDAPIVAGQLPEGEIIRSIHGYLGYVLLGTDFGVRFATADAEGNLTIGSLIRTDSSVLCFEGQDRFVWFGWTDYDGDSTGLGRLDLSVIPNGGLAPAYASDLMADGSGTVTSVVTFASKRVFAVAGQGFFIESGDRVPTGTLDTGLITYGLPDLKTAVYLDVKLRETLGTNRAFVSVDGGAFAAIGLRATEDVTPFTVGERSGETFEIRHELNDTDGDGGPVLSRWTLRSYPRPSQGEVFLVPVLLHEVVKDRNGQDVPVVPDLELAHILSLRESKELVAFHLGTGRHTVLVDDALFQYSHPTANGEDWNGTALLRLKSPAT